MIFGDDGVWLLFPLDKTQHIGMVSTEVRVLELVCFYFRITLQDTLLEMLDLVESVHVQLADERGPFVVFEPFGDNLSREAFVVQDLGSHVSVVSGADRVWCLGLKLYTPVNESPSSDHRITLEFSSSSRILCMTSITICKGGRDNRGYALV